MPELSFSEIKDGFQFEELVASFFGTLKNLDGTSIVDVNVKPSGTGADGGKDIIVDFTVSDHIRQFKRTWVIQCKFHERPVSANKLFGIDIPTLVHSYNASGYLLICKSRPTSSLTDLFKNLNQQSTHFQYSYEIWTGEQFRGKLISAPERIHEQYFPIFYRELKKIDINKTK